MPGGYGSTGPGGGDDRPKVIKAVFASAAAFDPDSIDDVHVTISKSTGPTLFAASLTSASAFWSQPNAAVKKWIYKDLAATVGVKKALLKESPPGSGKAGGSDSSARSRVAIANAREPRRRMDAKRRTGGTQRARWRTATAIDGTMAGS